MLLTQAQNDRLYKKLHTINNTWGVLKSEALHEFSKEEQEQIFAQFLVEIYDLYYTAKKEYVQSTCKNE